MEDNLREKIPVVGTYSVPGTTGAEYAPTERDEELLGFKIPDCPNLVALGLEKDREGKIIISHPSGEPQDIGEVNNYFSPDLGQENESTDGMKLADCEKPRAALFVELSGKKPPSGKKQKKQKVYYCEDHLENNSHKKSAKNSAVSPVESVQQIPRIKLLKHVREDSSGQNSTAEYENYSELIELVGCFLLPSGRSGNLRILLDLGATSNFINKRLVSQLKIPLEKGDKGEVSIGNGHNAQSSGETAPLCMKLGRIYKHTSTYTVMELGDFDVILGMPWYKFAKCTIPTEDSVPAVEVIYKKARLTLPTRANMKNQTRKCFHVSVKEFHLEKGSYEEIYTAHYQGWVPEIEETPSQSAASSNTEKMTGAAKKSVHKMEGPKRGGPTDQTDKGDKEDPISQIPRRQGVAALEEILREFESVFPADLPIGSLVDREISLKIPIKPGFTPPIQAPYRASAEGQETIQETLKYLYDHGFARDSFSEYGAPVTLAKKSDGTWRFCVDYRRLNAITKEAKYPLPRIEDCLDKLGKAKWFSKLDLRSGYWQVKVHPDDVEKTAFRTQNGHHEFLVVPFGLQGAPSTFQRLMNHYLRPYLGKFVLVYLDDILIYSNSEEEHLEHLKLVLQILKDKTLYAKGSKCDLFREKIAFLGFIVENHCISTDPEKIKAIKTWPEPTTVREVRSFLGLSNFYRKFVDHHSTIAKPLTDLLKSTEFEEKFGLKFTKLAPITLGEKEKLAFANLKQALISAPCLVIFDPDKPTEVWADTSYDNESVGAVLMQNHGKGFQPCSYLSKVLSVAESHYPTFEQELLGLKLAFVHWRHYVLPIRFTARTDHNGLKYLKTQPHLSERQWRWLAFFSEYQFDIKYKPGREFLVPDALSRRPQTEEDMSSLLRLRDDEGDHKMEIRVGPKKTKILLCLDKIVPEKIEKLKTIEKFDYSKDREFSKIIRNLKKDPDMGDKRPSYRMYVIEGPHLIWVDRMYDRRIVVPCAQRIPLIKEYHDTLLGGHLGTEKVYLSLKRHFYWPSMRDLIHRYISTCDSCQKNKTWNQKPLGNPQLMDIPRDNWECISLDFCGPLPKTQKGNDCVLVVSDHLSKMAYSIPCSTTITSKGTAEKFRDVVFRQHGLPKKVISDRGPQFVSHFWGELWKLMDTKVALITFWYGLRP